MPTLDEMVAERESLRTQLAEISNMQEPDDDDVIVQEELISRYEQIDGRVKKLQERMARLAAIEVAAAVPANVEPTVEPSSHEAPTMFMRTNVDPFADLDRIAHNLVPEKELRVRAEVLLERDEKRKEITHDYAETAYERTQALGTESGVAKHVILTGSQSYRDAFREYLRNPVVGVALMNELPMAVRAINLTNASGGFLLPYILDPTIVLTNNASANPYRRVSRIVQTTSNAWQGVNSAGVTAQMIAEATTASDMSPTVGQIQITPLKAVAWVLGSYEALDDTNFGEQLPGLLSDAKDRLESGKFSTGSGTSDVLGLLPALTGANRVAPGATGTAFQPGTGATNGALDVLALQAAVAPRFRQSNGAAYMANIAVLNKVRGVDVYGGGQFLTNLTTNTPPALLGQPLFEASDLPSGTTGTSAASGTGSATLVYGDFNQFIVCDRVGVSMLYDPMLKGSGNAQLPTGQAGWYMFWRYNSNISTTAAFRYLTIS